MNDYFPKNMGINYFLLIYAAGWAIPLPPRASSGTRNTSTLWSTGSINGSPGHVVHRGRRWRTGEERRKGVIMLPRSPPGVQGAGVVKRYLNQI